MFSGFKGRIWVGAALVAALVVGSAAALLTDVWRVDQLAMSLPPNQDEVRVCYGDFPWAGLVVLSDEMGHFRRHGLEMKGLPFSTGREAMERMIQGECDYAVAMSTPVAMAILDGQPVAILSEVHSSSRSTQILYRKDRGIRTPQDLKGRRVAVVPGISYEYAFDVFLENNAIRRESLNVISGTVEQLVPLLISGEVDAATLGFGLVAPLLSQHGKILDAFDIHALTEISVLIKNRAASHPERDVRMIRALWDAFQDYREDPSSAKARLLQILNAKAHAESKERFRWDQMDFHLGLSSMLFTVLMHELQWTQKVRASAPDLSAEDALERFIEADALRSIAPELVTYR